MICEKYNKSETFLSIVILEDADQLGGGIRADPPTQQIEVFFRHALEIGKELQNRGVLAAQKDADGSVPKHDRIEMIGGGDRLNFSGVGLSMKCYTSGKEKRTCLGERQMRGRIGKSLYLYCQRASCVRKSSKEKNLCEA